MRLFNWQPLTEADESLILNSIKAAESKTSGEIRVHLDKWCKTDPIYKAQIKFIHLKMHETEARNGVLIYVAVKEHKFAIIGDEGINSKVDPNFWESTKNRIAVHFKNGELALGIARGIEEAGIQLAKYFPYQAEDKNELNDEISYG